MRRYVFRLAILSLAALAPSVVRADDQQIAQQIMQKLKAEKDAGTLKGFSIDLQVDEGTVWLSGRVASEQQHVRALDLARRVKGVQQVVDDLTVGAPPSKTPIVANSPAPASTKAPASSPAPVSNPTSAGKPGIVMLPPPPVTVAPPPQPTQTTATELRPALTPGMVTNPFAMANAPKSAEPAARQNGSSGVVDVTAIPVESDSSSQAASQSARRSSSSGSNSVLNSISKTLVSAVHGSRQDESQPRQIQPASVSQEVAAATGGPVGSGVDPSAASRRGVVQAAQPVANVPQSVATADSLQPIRGAQQVAMMPMQMPYMVPVYAGSQMQVPLAMGPARTVNYTQMGGAVPGGAVGAPVPMYLPGSGVGIAPARYDHPSMPGYAWPSYAAYPNYAAVTYPKQYSPTAWPYIGPFYPYPQVPLGWRKVTMEWDDGWWMLDFKDRRTMYNH